MAYINLDEYNAKDLVKARQIRDKSIDIAKLLASDADKANSAKNIIIGFYKDYRNRYESACETAINDVGDYGTNARKYYLLKGFKGGLGDDTPCLLMDIKTSREYLESHMGYKFKNSSDYESMAAYADERQTAEIIRDYLLKAMFNPYNHKSLTDKIAKVLEALSPDTADEMMGMCGLYQSPKNKHVIIE